MRNIISKIIYGLCSLIIFINCHEIVASTNYTYSYFKQLSLKDLTCNSDTDCPQYSKCENYEENGQSQSICRFEYFLCRELDNEPCLHINSTIWNTKYQSYQISYTLEKLKPIIKTCPNSHAKKISCETQLCYDDSDCLSGTCFLHKCVTSENTDKNSIILCSGQEKEYYMLCGKDAGMKSEDEEECYSKTLQRGYCIALHVSKKLTNIIAILIIGVIVIVFISFIIYVIKNKKTKTNTESEKELEIRELKETTTK